MRLGRGGKRKRVACSWSGEHSGPATTGVETAPPCGHGRSTTPTCVLHLEVLLDQEGLAPKAVICPECQRLGHSRVLNTHDL